MPETPTFVPASMFSLDALGDIFTRSFENYFYPGTTTAATLSARVRIEQIDLHRSLVMRAGDDLAGIALLALRGNQAWCGGFGVMLPFRGRGLSHQLAMAMLGQAREAEARGCRLEVLTRNQRAINTYARAGFRPLRDLQVLEWRRSEDLPAATPAGDQLVQLEPAALLRHFATLHPVPAAWQRDLPALLVRGGMEGQALLDGDRPHAYALLTPAPDRGARLEDVGAEDTEQASALLLALQARYARLVSVNEPADGVLAPAFRAAGFTEIDRQHDLWIDL